MSSRFTYWIPEMLCNDDLLANEYSNEWRQHLLRKNNEEIKNCRKLKQRFTFYSPVIVKCIFDICKMLQQPPEVRYLAVDIFDRFLIEHFFKVNETFEEMENQSQSAWQIITERMLEQSLLRILTCIQISVKYCHSLNIITVSAVQEIMKHIDNNSRYSMRSIIKSEGRVYRNLNYTIPWNTALTYLEMYFDEFQNTRCFFIQIPLWKFFNICIHVLDIAIIYHQELYSNFKDSLQVYFEEENFSYNYSIVCIKGDFALLAASVIVTSSILIHHSTESLDGLLEILSSLGQCRKSHIRALFNHLLKIIQSILI